MPNRDIRQQDMEAKWYRESLQEVLSLGPLVVETIQ